MKFSFAVLIASWFYTGFIPSPTSRLKMAGTYGTFFSLPLCWLIISFGGEYLVWWWSLSVWIVFWMGIMFVENAEDEIGERIDWKGNKKSKDQNEIVIDETLGILVSCFPLTFMSVDNLYLVLAVAFVLFRFFDITKFPPIGTCDEIKNAFGVMLDDIVAGIYAGLILMIILCVVSL